MYLQMSPHYFHFLVPPTGQAPQPQQLQEVRRQNVMLGHDQMRGQFSHTVTTLPSNKRPNEMGRQIQSEIIFEDSFISTCGALHCNRERMYSYCMSAQLSLRTLLEF